MNDSSPIDDPAKLKIKEEVVLEKFEGEVEDGVLRERVFIEDGLIKKHEFLEDGEVVRTVVPSEGGND